MVGLKTDIEKPAPGSACRETAERLAMAMEVARVGMWDWDLAGNGIYFDDRYYTMAGYAPGEFPASIEEWQARVHPDNREEVVDALYGVIRGETDTASRQFRFRTKSGGWIWILGRGRVYRRNASGDAIRVVGTHTDITEQKQMEAEHQKSENQYRQLVEKAHDGIFIAQDGRIRFANPSLGRITGYTLEELMERPLVDLVHPADREMVMDRHARRLNGEEIPDYYSFRSIDKQGKALWLEINAVFFEWSGRPATLCFIRDITRTKAMENQLFQAQKMQAIGTLAGGIAHDFNNILSAMMGFTELCLPEIPSASRTAHRLNQVMQAGQRARDLVGQILAFSRQEEMDQKPVSIASIIEEAMKLIRASTPSTVSVATRIDKENAVVMADPTRIHQIVMNLCVNAAHAMRTRGGRMAVELSTCDLDDHGFAADLKGLAPGAYVRLTVSDTGHGMDRETVKRIFDPYFTTKGLGEGTGMGLSVVHGIVAGLGGAVVVYSEPGKGTAFHVYLPRLTADEETPGTDEELVVDGGTETILLVDDEAILLEMTGEMLARLGYRVVPRTSSEEAFQAFSANPHRFDLVITDDTMPGMTGLELSEKIWSSDTPAPVILCSGFSSGIPVRRARASGIRAILNKPVLKRELGETIRRVLDRR